LPWGSKTQFSVSSWVAPDASTFDPFLYQDIDGYGGKFMKRIAIFGVLGALALVVPVQAAPNYTPAVPHGHGPHSHACLPHNVGYNATGILVGESLTADGNGRYSGTIEVDVAKANHHGSTGDQTFTLTGARVKFHHGVDPTAPAAGSRVKLHGKITHLAKHCPSDGFTPTVTVKKVDLKQPKPQKG
jgi:hypothetical protein